MNRAFLAVALLGLGACVNSSQKLEQDTLAQCRRLHAQALSTHDPRDYDAEADCWNFLDAVRETHAEMRARAAADDDFPQTYQWTPTPTATLSAPPSAPAPSPLSNLGSTYQQPAPQTWGETPYAPIIPPVMRDQPISNVNPMIPPAAR